MFPMWTFIKEMVGYSKSQPTIVCQEAASYLLGSIHFKNAQGEKVGETESNFSIPTPASFQLGRLKNNPYTLTH